jgi:hypothetical protein
MSGYSETPLARKLGIKAGHRAAFPGAPGGFEALLGELPPGTTVKARAAGPLDVIVFFTRRRAELVRELALANRLVDNKVCAIDETWSGLRLVIRLRDRPG